MIGVTFQNWATCQLVLLFFLEAASSSIISEPPEDFLGLMTGGLFIAGGPCPRRERGRRALPDIGPAVELCGGLGVVLVGVMMSPFSLEVKELEEEVVPVVLAPGVIGNVPILCRGLPV